VPPPKTNGKRTATPAANPLVVHQAEINRSTVENWASFAPHRRRVTDLIVGGSSRQESRLAVLGAGNCNDLDLESLAASFAAVDLFDVDAQALARGIRSQSMESSPRFFLHGDVDFTGILPRLATLPQKPDRQAELEELVRLAARIPSLGNNAGYEVVASTCVLSQLISSAVLILGESEPLLPLLVLAMRKTHFRLLCNMVAPRGTAVFVSDLVSSDSCPALLAHSKDDLQPLMEAVVHDRNFFTGLNPYAILGCSAKLRMIFACTRRGSGRSAASGRP
jgi:hypothetical protein